MKILHIIDSLGLGGAQTVVKGIFEAQKDNKDIYLFSLRRKDIETNVEHRNVTVFNSTKKYSLTPLFALKKLVEREKIDVLHCHLFRSNITGIILKLFWFPKIKLIVHEHGEIFQGHFFYNISLRLFKKYINKFIAVSNATKESLVKLVDISEGKIDVLQNFVDLEKFSRKNITWNIQDERDKLGIKKDEFVVGFVGRLDEVKGCEYLIRALIHLKGPFKVIIIGDGEVRNRLQELAKFLKVSERVLFLGYRKDTVFAYSLFDVLVVPSVTESFGLSVVEAQAMNIPVIISEVPGLNELIIDKESGLFFKSKDSVDLGQKINQLIEDTELMARLSGSAQKNVNNFCLKKYINNLSQIYDR